MILSKSEKNSDEVAAEILSEKKIVVLPTDTVYGLSAIAIFSGKKSGADEAVNKIKAAKSAPPQQAKPLIELIASPNEIQKYTDQPLPKKLLDLWPGPLTIIVKNNAWYASLTGRETSAFRCPGDEWLRNVISLCGSPIYSTSANRTGEAVLARVSEIRAEFEKEVALIIDDGDKADFSPSTIVSIVGGETRVLRQGSAWI